MRRAAKVDGNHVEIVAALKKAGIAVKSLAQLGNGMPDLLCAFRGVNVLVEVKAPDGKLRKEQVEFVATWPGAVFVARTAEEAIRAVVEAARVPAALGQGAILGAVGTDGGHWSSGPQGPVLEDHPARGGRVLPPPAGEPK